MQIRVIKSRAAAPLSSLEGATAVAALTAGYRLIPGDKAANFEDTVEEIAGQPQRETCWVFDDTVQATFGAEQLPLDIFCQRFRDLDWCLANPDHPIAYLRHAHENLNRYREHFAKHAPMIRLRNGKRTLTLRADATEEEKSKWMKLL